jgi:Zn-dependent peptidase ImmA (M78 family)
VIKPDYERASLEAKRVLEENFIIGPPVLAYELAENCGLKVFVDVFDDACIAGMLDIENKTITVNKHDSLTRQSFTIAHELGHWLLHVKHGTMTEKEFLYRKPLGGPDDDWREKEANWFAANLLVPSEMLKEYASLSQEEAARVFRVSPSVIGYRRMVQNG